MTGTDDPERQSGGLPTSSFARASRMLQLPLGAAQRQAVGLSRRLLGADADQVERELRGAAAEQLFSVLGELKGGAMKFGQALSMFEAFLPEEVAAPYRHQLAKLQDSAPPLPSSRVQTVLRNELGPGWRDRFESIDLRPAAAASIGQVHRAVLTGGRPVAIKVQYPGADQALRSDLRQIERLAGVVAPLAGGVDVVTISRELAARISEEVDYTLEAQHQSQAAAAFAGDPEFTVPQVHHATSRVLISDWLDGRKLSTAADSPRAVRNRVGLSYARFLFAGPARAGLLHADPHPGNYLVLPDGRLGVVDFGLVARLPDGLPPAMGRLIQLAIADDASAMTAGLAAEGFIAKDIDAGELLGYLAPFVEPARSEEFHFDRAWMREQFLHVRNSSTRDGVSMKLTIPPVYALIHRVWLGGIAVLAQLDVTARFRDVLAEFLPGWHD
ncbi:ABC1 kinase family protein [Micropruina sp.]|uniref:ABC1 kinase family protein n=1 Tax=Micropruina sp. TaxID=2737536 RepID=UPI0039E38DA5